MNGRVAREREREGERRREAEAEKYVSLKPETTEREGVGPAVEVAELAHRFPQPLGLGGTGRHEIPRQIRDTRHPADGFGRERVYVTECATTEIERRKPNFATDVVSHPHVTPDQYNTSFEYYCNNTAVFVYGRRRQKKLQRDTVG